MIGRGGFAITRQARQFESQNDTCLKIISKWHAESKLSNMFQHRWVERGSYEMLLRMSRELPHANVVRYLDVLESPVRYYEVMELLSGPSLCDALERQGSTWSERKCACVMLDLLKALNHIHTVVG